MSDRRLRALQRRFAGGDPDARGPLIAERLRVGDLSQDLVGVAAWSSDPDAVAAIAGLGAPVGCLCAAFPPEGGLQIETLRHGRIVVADHLDECGRRTSPATFASWLGGLQRFGDYYHEAVARAAAGSLLIGARGEARELVEVWLDSDPKARALTPRPQRGDLVWDSPPWGAALSAIHGDPCRATSFVVVAAGYEVAETRSRIEAALIRWALS